jgi:hypothetical protein
MSTIETIATGVGCGLAVVFVTIAISWIIAETILWVRDRRWERQQFRGVEVTHPDGTVERFPDVP